MAEHLMTLEAGVLSGIVMLFGMAGIAVSLRHSNGDPIESIPILIYGFGGSLAVAVAYGSLFVSWLYQYATAGQ